MSDAPPFRRVTLIGDGQMALILAGLLDMRGDLDAIRIWSHDPEEGARLGAERTSVRLPRFRLPDSVTVCTADDAAFEDVDLIILATPTQFIRGVLTRLAPHIPADVPLASVAKGFEIETRLQPLDIVADVLDGGRDSARSLAALSGPTIAAEIARGLPATIVAASEDAGFADALQDLLSSRHLRVYTSDDPLAVEIAGAAKNVIAIAAGIVDGIGLGINAKSALLARGLAEIARLGVALGARPETFFGLAGVGDLATTCFSPDGRNRSCGEALGRGESLEDYLARSACVVEGAATTRAVRAMAEELGVDMPIVRAVHAILYEGVPPREAATELMTRAPTADDIG